MQQHITRFLVATGIALATLSCSNVEENTAPKDLTKASDRGSGNIYLTQPPLTQTETDSIARLQAEYEAFLNSL